MYKGTISNLCPPLVMSHSGHWLQLSGITWCFPFVFLFLTLGTTPSLLPRPSSFCDSTIPCHVGGGQKGEVDLLWFSFRAEFTACLTSTPYSCRLKLHIPSTEWGIPNHLDCILTSIKEILNVGQDPQHMYIFLILSACISFFIAKWSQVVRARTQSWDLSPGSNLYWL